MRRLSVPVLLAVSLLVFGEGCRRGRVLVAKPSVGRGVRIEANDGARIKGVYVTVPLVVINETDEALEVNRNQIAVVGPEGREVYRDSGRELTTVPPRSRASIALEVEAPDKNFLRDAPGIYLRFDGVYVGNMRVDVPPMAIGEPTWRPGNVNRSFASAGTTLRPGERPAAQPQATAAATDAKPGFFRRMMNAARGKDGEPAAPAGQGAAPGATAGTTTAAPVADTAGMQEYRGPRRQLRTAGLKCAAMPLRTKDMKAQMAFVMDELVLSELQQSGFESIGPDDINALIGFEKTKQAIGCDDMACATELGNALGVNYLVAGSVAIVEGSVVLTLKLLDTHNPKVLARTNKVAEGGQKNMPRVIAEAVQDLVERSGL